MASVQKENIPYITTNQMREVDRLMIEDYRIELMQMMENAGRNLAELAISLPLNDKPIGKEVIVLAGLGGNGGGGLVCARHLHNRGANIVVVLSRSPEEFTAVPGHQLDILRQMRVRITENIASITSKPDLIIDALIGYSLSGDPRGETAGLIDWVNAQSCPVLSLDVPSGLDATTGKAYKPCILADATMTLALPKIGFLQPTARPFIGDLFLADISVPRELYRSMGIEVGNIFSNRSVIKLE